MAGYTDSSGEGDDDIWIMKLNSTGDVTWHRNYGGISSDQAYAIEQTSDGGYIVAGDTLSFGMGGRDVCVLKLNSEGDVSWSKTYGESDYDRAGQLSRPQMEDIS